jgi:hypothetical protein
MIIVGVPYGPIDFRAHVRMQEDRDHYFRECMSVVSQVISKFIPNTEKKKSCLLVNYNKEDN